MPPLHLIDGTLYFFRALFGVPELFFDPEGRPVNGVKGYLQTLLLLLRGAEYAAVAFDESLNTSFRNDLYPPYKANRPPPDANILFQLDACRTLTRQLGVLTLAHRRYEADDIIATLAGRARRPVVVVSRDKDLCQLLRPGLEIIDSAGAAPVRHADFERREGYPPHLFPDFQALNGDAVDNVPGVAGVGRKTARRLVAELGSLEAIFHRREAWHRAGVKPGSRVHANLDAARTEAFTFRDVLRLHRRVPLRYRAGATRVPRGSLAGVRRSLARLGLGANLAGSLATYEAGR